MASPTSSSDFASPAVRYEPLVLLALAAVVGIACDRWHPLAITTWWLLAGGLLGVWLPLWLMKQHALASPLVLAALACAAGAWHHDRWRLVADDHLVCHIREETQPICLEARVLQSPRILPAPPYTPLRSLPSGDRSRLEVEVVRVRAGERWQEASGRTRLSVDGHLLGIESGDVIRVFALYQRPAPALNPGEFDFADIERSSRRWCQLTATLPECVAVVDTGSRFDSRRWIDSVRRGGRLQLREHISPSRAELAAAVLLGEREYLDADRSERFLVTGTVHLLAISGLHLGILMYVFWPLGRTGVVSRRATLIAAIAFAIGYALLTDARPPVVRASVLIVVFCLARWSGRKRSPWQILAAAALVVLAINPTTLFHAGAQFSFLAVAMLALFRDRLVIRPPADPLDRLIEETRPLPVRAGKHSMRLAGRIFLTGAVIWLAALPLVWLRYHLLSPIGLLLNPLVALPMAVALFAGFAVLVLGWIAPPLGHVAGWICDRSLSLLESAITWLGPLPGGYQWLPAPPVWWVAVFYVALAAVALWPSRIRARWLAAGAAAWIAIAFYLAMPIRPASEAAPRPLAVTFVSVGHGAAVLVELPDGRNLLYDCGRLGSPLSGARPIAAVLWSRGITHLDAVVISHADSDHYNALPEILERFSVGVVYVSTVMWDGTSPGPALLRQTIEESGTPIVLLKAGDRLKAGGGTRMEVLHPPRGGVFGADNANSIVLLVEHGPHRVLLTGDLEARGLNDLLAEPALDCDVLMAPHHGSARSNPRGLAEWCRPEHVVISGGRDFELGRDPELVAREFYAAGANVYHTSQHGAVQFELLGEEIRVRPHRRPPHGLENSVYFGADAD
jgi:competence protein ComEC